MPSSRYRTVELAARSKHLLALYRDVAPVSRPPEGALRRSVKAVPSRWSGILTHGGQSSRSAWRRGLFFPPRGSPANGCGRSASRDMTLRGPPTLVGGVLTAGHRGGWLVAIFALVCAPIGAALATWLGMQPIAPGTSIRVTSIPSLLAALDDNAVTEIVVANGTYRVSPASSQRTDSLWIGARFADRTRSVTVRAETRGGVTFDGGGTTSFGGMSFEDGAHDQTWDGFNFANGRPTSTGVIMFGGDAGRPPAHHITLRNITLKASLTGRNPQHDHGIYVVGGETGREQHLWFEDYHGRRHLPDAAVDAPSTSPTQTRRTRTRPMLHRPPA